MVIPKKNVFIAIVALLGALFMGRRAFVSLFSVKTSKETPFSRDFYVETLSNGMKVVAIKHAAAPRVVVELVYAGVGASLEGPGKKGLAHSIEHMIFKGTKELPEGAINELTQRYGAQTDAFTTLDTTGYWFEADNNNWKPLVRVLADCMQNAVFDDQAYASEVKTIIQEMRQQFENPDEELLRVFLATAVPQDHPYHYLAAGDVKDIATFSSETMKEFYAAYYRPELATLVLFGDLDPRQAVADVRSYLEAVPSQHTILPDVLKSHPMPRFGKHTVIYSKQKTPRILLGWCVPGGGGKDYATAQVLSEMLESCVYGALQRRLVDTEHCAENVDVALLPARGMSFFYILCNPLKGKLDHCVRAINEELHALATKRVDQKDLVNSIDRMRVDARSQFEAITTSASGIPLDWIIRYSMCCDENVLFNPLQGYSSVTPEDIKRFVSAYLSVESMNRIDMIPVPGRGREAWIAQRAEQYALEQKVLDAHPRTRAMVAPVVPDSYPPVQSPTITLPVPTYHGTLANGLEVVVVNKPDAGLCSIHIGCRDAGYFERSVEGYPLKVMSQMLLEGSEGTTKQADLEWFDEHSVMYEFLKADWTASCAPAEVHGVLAHMLRIIHSPQFDNVALKKTKKRLINKLMRQKGATDELEDRAKAHALWPNTTNDWGFDDAIKAIRSVTQESLKKLHEEMTNPAALICVVVGDVNAQEIVKDIQEATISWKQVPYEPKPVISSGSTVEGLDVPADTNQVTLTYLRSSNTSFTDPKLPAIKALSQHMFSSLGSRLFAVREATGLFYDADGEFASNMSRQPGFDRLSVGVAKDKLPEAEERMRQFVLRDMAQPVVQEDVDGARVACYGDFASSVSGVDGCAEYFMTLRRNRLPDDYYKKFFAALDAVTADDMSAIAQQQAQAGQFGRVRVGSL